MKKKGQFFLIAALVIVVILVGFIGLVNYGKVERDSSIKNLQTELENEITYTLDYGSIHNLDSAEFRTIFKNLSSIYINKSVDKTTIFLYGAASGTMIVKGKNSKDLDILINVNGNWSTLNEGIGEFEEEYTLNENIIYLNISDNQYAFEFNSGQNFKYLISQGKEKENIIIKG
jgi:hypothetical protein